MSKVRLFLKLKKKIFLRKLFVTFSSCCDRYICVVCSMGQEHFGLALQTQVYLCVVVYDNSVGTT